MILQNFKRLVIDDFPTDSKTIINKLALYFNPDIEPLYNALANRLNFADNFDATVKTISLSVNSSGVPTGNANVIKLKTISGNVPKATGAIVTNAQNTTNSTTYPTSGVTISFTQSQGIVTITHITGLTPNDTWSLNITVFHS
jgi:hypothetical protein